jgi:hypothetical protein
VDEESPGPGPASCPSRAIVFAVGKQGTEHKSVRITCSNLLYTLCQQSQWKLDTSSGMTLYSRYSGCCEGRRERATYLRIEWS